MFDQNNPRVPIDFSQYRLAKNKQGPGKEIHLRKKDEQASDRYGILLFQIFHRIDYIFVTGLF